MRKAEEAAEAAAREVARMRSELDALNRPVQQYRIAGTADRLRTCSERLAQTRETLTKHEREWQVGGSACWLAGEMFNLLAACQRSATQCQAHSPKRLRE